MSLEKAKQAAALFALDPNSVEPAAMRENLTYSAFADGHKYALRLHRPGYSAAHEILSELQFMAALAQGGASVPEPRVSKAGELVEDMNGQLCSALSWMPGRTLSQVLDDPDADRAAIYTNLGACLAKLHNSADDWTLPEGFERRAWNREGLLGDTPVWGRFWDNPYLSDDERSQLTTIRAQADKTLREIDGTLDYGLIHADAVADNVLVDGTTPTLIDFDDSGFGYRLFDLATPLNKIRDRKDYSALEAAMFDGYRKHRALDLTHFPLIARLRALTYLGWIVPRIDEPGGHQRLERFRKAAFALL